MSKDSLSNILLDNDARLDNSSFLVNISLRTPVQIFEKSDDRICNLFKQNDFHIQKIEN